MDRSGLDRDARIAGAWRHRRRLADRWRLAGRPDLAEPDRDATPPVRGGSGAPGRVAGPVGASRRLRASPVRTSPVRRSPVRRSLARPARPRDSGARAGGSVADGSSPVRSDQSIIGRAPPDRLAGGGGWRWRWRRVPAGVGSPGSDADPCGSAPVAVAGQARPAAEEGPGNGLDAWQPHRLHRLALGAPGPPGAARLAAVQPGGQLRRVGTCRRSARRRLGRGHPGPHREGRRASPAPLRSGLLRACRPGPSDACRTYRRRRAPLLLPAMVTALVAGAAVAGLDASVVRPHHGTQLCHPIRYSPLCAVSAWTVVVPARDVVRGVLLRQPRRVGRRADTGIPHRVPALVSPGSGSRGGGAEHCRQRPTGRRPAPRRWRESRRWTWARWRGG